MPSVAVLLLGALAAMGGVLYPAVVRPRMELLGIGRIIVPKGNGDCVTVPELQACEDMALHQPTGQLYLACSTPAGRVNWTPAVGRLNASGRSTSDYIALYDPATSKSTRLDIKGFDSPRGLSLHGMDVVPSSTDPSVLWVYLVNHRPPLEGDAAAAKVGADSCVEVFKTTVGGRTLTHVKTVEDPEIIVTPNDLVGKPDGSGFWFTNDHGTKTSPMRFLEDISLHSVASVGHCSLNDGCKFAATGLTGANGIARDTKTDAFYVSSFGGSEVKVFDKQADDTFVLADVINPGVLIDNLSIDNDGTVWGAGILTPYHFTFNMFPDPHNIRSASSAVRISQNTGHSSYFGDKYKVERPFEDDGELASGGTSVAYDVERGLLAISGVASPHLTVCKLNLS